MRVIMCNFMQFACFYVCSCVTLSLSPNVCGGGRCGCVPSPMQLQLARKFVRIRANSKVFTFRTIFIILIRRTAKHFDLLLE